MSGQSEQPRSSYQVKAPVETNQQQAEFSSNIPGSHDWRAVGAYRGLSIHSEATNPRLTQTSRQSWLPEKDFSSNLLAPCLSWHKPVTDERNIPAVG